MRRKHTLGFSRNICCPVLPSFSRLFGSSRLPITCVTSRSAHCTACTGCTRPRSRPRRLLPPRLSKCCLNTIFFRDVFAATPPNTKIISVRQHKLTNRTRGVDHVYLQHTYKIGGSRKPEASLFTVHHEKLARTSRGVYEKTRGVHREHVGRTPSPDVNKIHVAWVKWPVASKAVYA